MRRGLSVRDIMTRRVVTAEPTETISEVSSRLAHHHITGAPAMQEGKVVGMISERDIIRAALPLVPSDGSALEALAHPNHIQDRPQKKMVGDVMMTLVVEVSPDASVWEAAAEMEQRGINRLPVVDDRGKLVGIVSRADVVRAMAQQPKNAMRIG